MRIRATLPALLLVLGALGCPPPPFHGDPGPSPSYNHSQSATLQNWFQGTQGASGLWTATVGNFRYALVGTDRGLHIQSLDATSVFVDVDGPGVASVVLAQVEARGIDLVVIASHGAGGFERLVVGSVADKVIRGARVPVLVVRPEKTHGLTSLELREPSAL